MEDCSDELENYKAIGGSGNSGVGINGAPVAQGAGLLYPKGNPNAGAHLESHAVRVVIQNGFARTEVDQVFGNDTDQDYEAIYTFPLPKQASL